MIQARRLPTDWFAQVGQVRQRYYALNASVLAAGFSKIHACTYRRARKLTQTRKVDGITCITTLPLLLRRSSGFRVSRCAPSSGLHSLAPFAPPPPPSPSLISILTNVDVKQNVYGLRNKAEKEKRKSQHIVEGPVFEARSLSQSESLSLSRRCDLVLLFSCPVLDSSKHWTRKQKLNQQMLILNRMS